MIVDKKIIKQVAEYHNVFLDKDFIDYIYQVYGHEPFPYERDEQGLYQEVSKLVKEYKNGNLTYRLKTKEETMKEEIEYLKDLCMENIRELADVKEILFERTQILNNYDIEYPDDDIEF